MSDLISALILAVVQGIAEWLPISSSGHLVLFQQILNYPGSVMFDVALHFGTLMAVFVYFGKDIVDILEDLLKRKFHTQNAKLGYLLAVGTIPAAIVGFLFKNAIEKAFESLILVALGFGITGLFLFIASLDLRKKKDRISYKDSFLIGIGQAVAIMPGISRSGSTISSGLLLGLDEKTAIKFSFLLSIPAIIGANIIEIGNKTLPRELFWATLLAFVVGLLTIHLMLKYLLTNKKNLRWFGIYTFLLAFGIGVYLIFS